MSKQNKYEETSATEPDSSPVNHSVLHSVKKKRSLIFAIFSSFIALICIMVALNSLFPKARLASELQWRESGTVPYEINSSKPFSGIIVEYEHSTPTLKRGVKYLDDLRSVMKYNKGKTHGKQLKIPHTPLSNELQGTTRIQYYLTDAVPNKSIKAWFNNGQLHLHFKWSFNPFGRKSNHGTFKSWYHNGQLSASGKFTVYLLKENTHLRFSIFLAPELLFDENGESIIRRESYLNASKIIDSKVFDHVFSEGCQILRKMIKKQNTKYREVTSGVDVSFGPRSSAQHDAMMTSYFIYYYQTFTYVNLRD